jgi:hypothetical protein
LKGNDETEQIPFTLREFVIELKKKLSTKSLTLKNAKYGIEVKKNFEYISFQRAVFKP